MTDPIYGDQLIFKNERKWILRASDIFCVCVESDVSPAIGSRFPVLVLFGVRKPSYECSDSSLVREDTYA